MYEKEALSDTIKIAVLETNVSDLKQRVTLVEGRTWATLTLTFGTFCAVVADIVIRMKGG